MNGPQVEPVKITVHFHPSQRAGISEAGHVRMPFSVEHEGVMYHDMVIVSWEVHAHGGGKMTLLQVKP